MGSENEQELTESGTQSRNGSRLDLKELGLELVERSFFEVLKKGRTKPPPCRGSLMFMMSDYHGMILGDTEGYGPGHNKT